MSECRVIIVLVAMHLYEAYLQLCLPEVLVDSSIGFICDSMTLIIYETNCKLYIYALQFSNP